eukprot:3128007-Rhodomonas_salina.1
MIGSIRPTPVFAAMNSSRLCQPSFSVENLLFQTSQTAVKVSVDAVRDKESRIVSLMCRACWHSGCSGFQDVVHGACMFHHLSLANGADVHVEVVATNAQGFVATAMSEPITVSTFEPRVDILLDGNSSRDTDFHWQSSASSCSWRHNLQAVPAFSHFEAFLLESSDRPDGMASNPEIHAAEAGGIAEFRIPGTFSETWAHKLIAGPVRIPREASSTSVDGLGLQNGRKYFWMLLVCSNARLCTAAVSDGFILETDMPSVGCVSIGDTNSFRLTPAPEYIYVSSSSLILFSWIATSGISSSSDRELLESCDGYGSLSGIVGNSSSYIKSARVAIIPIDEQRNASEISSSIAQYTLEEVYEIRPRSHPCCTDTVAMFSRCHQLSKEDIGSNEFSILASIGDSTLVVSTKSAIFLLNARTKSRHFFSESWVSNTAIATSENFLAFETSHGLSVFNAGTTDVHRFGAYFPNENVNQCFGLTNTGQIIVVTSHLGTVTVYEWSKAAWVMQAQYQLPGSIGLECTIRTISPTIWLIRSNSRVWTIFSIEKTGLESIGTLSATSDASIAAIEKNKSGIVAVGDPFNNEGSGSVDVYLVAGLHERELSTVCSILGHNHQRLGTTIALSRGDVQHAGKILMASFVENLPHTVVVYEVHLFRNSEPCSMIGMIQPQAGHVVLSTELFMLGSTILVRSAEQSSLSYLFCTSCGTTSVAAHSPGEQLDRCLACPSGEVAVHENEDFCESCTGVKCQDQSVFTTTMELPSESPLAPGKWYRADLEVMNRAGAQSAALSVSFAWDFTPPIVGIVEDRTAPVNTDVNHTESIGDVDFVSHNMSVVGAWRSFSDPESAISRYNVSLGTRPGIDDVYAWRRLPPSASHIVFPAVPWVHGRTFYVNVECCNGAIPEACVMASSDGIALDTTEPVISSVYDGFVEGSDWEQQTFADALFASWVGEEDVGRIAEYEWSVLDLSSNTTIVSWRSVAQATFYGVWDIQLPTDFRGISCVRAINEAGLRSEIRCSDGISLGKMQQTVYANKPTTIAFSLNSIRNQAPSKGSETTYSQISIPSNTIADGYSVLVGQLKSQEYNTVEFKDPKLANLSLVPNMKIGNYSFVATVLNENHNSLGSFEFSAPVTLSFVLDPDAMVNVYPSDDVRNIAPALLLRNTSSGLWINALQTCSRSQLAAEARWEFDRETQIFTARICHFTQFALAYQATPTAIVQSSVLDLPSTQQFAELRANGSDHDGFIISFLWTLQGVEPNHLNSSELVVIEEVAAASTSVSGLQPLHRYEFRVQVEDNDFATAHAKVWVTVFGPTILLSAVSLPSSCAGEHVLVPQPILHALDAQHRVNVFQSDIVTVSLLLSNHAGDGDSGVLTGTTAVAIANGVAQFTDLKLNYFGGYTLRFHALESNVSIEESIVVLAACQAGTTLNYNAECEPCQRGHFKAEFGCEGCTPCPAGKFSATEGSSSCQQCAEGTYGRGVGATACGDCPPGTSSPQGSISDTSCSPNTHDSYSEITSAVITTSSWSPLPSSSPSPTPSPSPASETIPPSPQPEGLNGMLMIGLVLGVLVCCAGLFGWWCWKRRQGGSSADPENRNSWPFGFLFARIRAEAAK